MYEIKSVSTLNLRGGVSAERHKMLDDPIPFTCSLCMKDFKLGENAFVMLRILFIIEENEMDICMCDRCADKFTDVSVFGPRGNSFEFAKSQLVRASIQEKDKFCFNCLSGEGSHIFIKYRSAGAKSIYSKRLCARCSISYLTTLKPEMVEKWE